VLQNVLHNSPPTCHLFKRKERPRRSYLFRYSLSYLFTWLYNINRSLSKIMLQLLRFFNLVTHICCGRNHEFDSPNPNVNLGVLIFEFERRLGKYNTKIDNIYL
jgi:hypothetical protein